MMTITIITTTTIKIILIITKKTQKRKKRKREREVVIANALCHSSSVAIFNSPFRQSLNQYPRSIPRLISFLIVYTQIFFDLPLFLMAVVHWIWLLPLTSGLFSLLHALTNHLNRFFLILSSIGLNLPIMSFILILSFLILVIICLRFTSLTLILWECCFLTTQHSY